MRKRFVPTDEQRENVEAMVGFGIPQEQIARLVKNPETGKPISEMTLRRAFHDEIETGQTVANVNVAKSMYEMATKGDATSTKLGAAAFWLARRMGWKETTRTEVEIRNVDPNDLTDAELADIATEGETSHRRRRSPAAAEGPPEPSRVVH